MLGFEIPLGVDLNGNGEPDKIEFSSFDLVADITGSVVDLQDDPTFGPIELIGPTTASSHQDGPDSAPPPSHWSAPPCRMRS